MNNWIFRGGKEMTSGRKNILIVAAVALIVLASLYSFFRGQYNTFVTLDETVKSSWAQVENQLQRRYDLIPNLVETVKGYARQEKDVLIEVTNARAVSVEPEPCRKRFRQQ
jgi:LemA protein